MEQEIRNPHIDEYLCVNYKLSNNDCLTCDRYGRNLNTNTDSCYGSKRVIFEGETGYEDCIGPAYLKNLEGKVVWYKNEFRGVIKNEFRE